MEVDEVPVEGDAAPFPGEGVVMMIHGRCPSLERRHVDEPSLGTLAR
jgi:hypothetical protein